MTVRAQQSEMWWKWGLRLSSLVLVAVVWEVVGRSLHSLLMPTFVKAMAALGRLLLTRQLWDAVWLSNQAMIIGFLASVVVGIPLGLLMGRMKTAEEIADIYLNLVLVTPMAPLIPIVILATGLGLPSRVLVVFIFTFVFIVVNTRVGLRSVDSNLIEMARSFGANERQLWIKILLPGALPAIMTGVRIGLGRAITGMVTVELLMIATGIGRLLLFFDQTFDSASLYAVVFVVLVEAVLLMEGAKRLEKGLLPWQNEVAAA